MKLRLAAIVGIVVLLLVAVSGVVLAQDDGDVALSVIFLTTPDGVITLEDTEGNTLNVWVFNSIEPLDVAWLPDAEANSYRVGLFQLNGDTLAVEPIQWGDHWASNPNGTQFTFGGYTTNVYCNCLYWVEVWPTIGFQYLDPATDTYEYDYVYTGGVIQVSDFFITQ